jgi:hypothetical protein
LPTIAAAPILTGVTALPVTSPTPVTMVDALMSLRWNQGNNDNPVSWADWTGLTSNDDRCQSSGDLQCGTCTDPFRQDSGYSFGVRRPGPSATTSKAPCVTSYLGSGYLVATGLLAATSLLLALWLLRGSQGRRER